MKITIQSVELDGQFWIDVSMDGYEMERRGPLPDADEAEATAYRLVSRDACRSGRDHTGAEEIPPWVILLN